MKENIGRLFKSKPENIGMDNDADITLKLLDVYIDSDGDECCSIEWLEGNNYEQHISKIYLDDFEYLFSTGIYYWI